MQFERPIPDMLNFCLGNLRREFVEMALWGTVGRGVVGKVGKLLGL